MISIGDLIARVSNVNISDREAEQQIEDAVVRASVEIRERARQARKSEKSNYESNRIRDAEQEKTGQKNREAGVREAKVGEERQKILAQVENAKRYLPRTR